MKLLISLLLLSVASLSYADPFDAQYCTVVSGPTAVEGCTTYHPATVNALQTHRAKFSGVLKAQGQVKDSGGPYSVTLSETVTDKATGAVTKNGPFVSTGLEAHDVAKIVHSIYKAADKFVSDHEGKAKAKKK